MNTKKLLPFQIVLAVLIILNISLIFMFSLQSGEKSAQTSGGVVDVVAGVVVEDYEEMTPEQKEEVTDKLGLPIRKLAHFAEYASLAFLSCLFLGTFKLKKLVLMTVPVAFVVFIACIDELILQKLTDGRVGQISDVLIDTSGGIFGMLIAFIIVTIITKKLNKKQQLEYTNI